MTSMLVAERAPAQARVLVLAPRRHELKALADGQFRLAFLRHRPVGGHASRRRTGRWAPSAACPSAAGLLRRGIRRGVRRGGLPAQLHFVDRPHRLDTLEQIRRRLVPGAFRSSSRISVSGKSEPERSLDRPSTSRSAEQPPAMLKCKAGDRDEVIVLSPEEDEAVLRKAGFRMFACSMRDDLQGWVDTPEFSTS